MSIKLGDLVDSGKLKLLLGKVYTKSNDLYNGKIWFKIFNKQSYHI